MIRNHRSNESINDEELGEMEEKISKAFDKARERINEELKKQRAELPDDIEYSHDLF